jgi:hypothetical protein
LKKNPTICIAAKYLGLLDKSPKHLEYAEEMSQFVDSRGIVKLFFGKDETGRVYSNEYMLSVLELLNMLPEELSPEELADYLPEGGM